MTSDYTQLNVGTGGDVMDEEAITYGDAPTTRKRPRVVISGGIAAELAVVMNTPPAGTEYGLVVRAIPSGTQTVATADSSGTGTTPLARDDTIVLLRQILSVLESNAVVDTKRRQRVCIDGIGPATDCTTTVPVSSTPVAGAINMGNVVMQFGAQATAAAAGVDSRFFMIDTARNAYANGIRQNLAWS